MDTREFYGPSDHVKTWLNPQERTSASASFFEVAMMVGGRVEVEMSHANVSNMLANDVREFTSTFQSKPYLA